jgi:hypothetical protein
MKRKLTVITDAQGKVLVTQEGHEFSRHPQSGILSGIVAGPGQNAHKIEYDVPELRTSADVEKFHKELSDHLAKKC